MGETVTGNYFQLLGVHADRSAARCCRTTIARRAARRWSSRIACGTASTRRARRPSASRFASTASRTRSSASRREVFTGMVPLLAPELWTPMAYVDDVEPGGIISTVPSPTGNDAARAPRHALDVRQGPPEDRRDLRAGRAPTCGSSAGSFRPPTSETNKDRDVVDRADQGRAHSSRGRSHAAADRRSA